MANIYYSDDIQVKDYAIGGKLITCVATYNDSMIISSDEIKMILAKSLAKGMIEKKLIEFTKRYDPMQDQNIIHARCYLAPDGQVKILRELKV